MTELSAPLRLRGEEKKRKNVGWVAEKTRNRRFPPPKRIYIYIFFLIFRSSKRSADGRDTRVREDSVPFCQVFHGSLSLEGKKTNVLLLK